MDSYTKAMTVALSCIAVGSFASTAMVSIGEILALCVLLVQGLKERSFPVAGKKMAGVICFSALFFFALLFSEFLTDSLAGGRNHLLNELRYMPWMFLSILYIHTCKQVRMLFWAFSIGVLISGVMSVQQYLAGQLPAGAQDFRTFYLNTLLIVLPFLAIMLRNTKLRAVERGLFLVVCVTIVLIILGISNGRSVWIAFGCMLAVWALIDRIWRSKLWIVLVVVSVCFAIYAMISPTVYHRLLTITDPSWNYNMNRIYIQTSAIQMIQDYPITGIGAGNFANMYPAYKSEQEYENLDHPHNYYLRVMVEHGFIGFIGVCSFWIFVCCQCWKMHKSKVGVKVDFAIALMLAIIATMIIGFFEENMMDKGVFRVMYLMIGITLAVDAMEDGEIKRGA